jgi:hypothetical protein
MPIKPHLADYGSRVAVEAADAAYYLIYAARPAVNTLHREQYHAP